MGNVDGQPFRFYRGDVADDHFPSILGAGLVELLVDHPLRYHLAEDAGRVQVHRILELAAVISVFKFPLIFTLKI